jgi:type IV pilus assembly protein PilW
MAIMHTLTRSRLVGRRLQRGLTLIEFMISIVLGMIIVAALATLVADQSVNRAEIDRSGRLIENGRYAIRALAEDLQMAGYWGELSSPPTAPAGWSDPCGASPAAPTKAEVEASLGWHVTGLEVPSGTARPGYNSTAPMPTTVACLNDLKAGTDVLVIRRTEPDSSAYETAGAVDLGKLASNGSPVNNTRLFMQTGLDPATNLFSYKIDLGGNGGTFDLKRKDGASLATVRKIVVRIYYVTTCSICTGGSPDSIPSLKMKELVEGPGWSAAITVAEGIENLQLEYGMDTATVDGAPDGSDQAATGVATGDWPAAVTAKIYLLARSLETAPGYDDAKTYPLGLAGTVTPAGAERKYRRHVFVQSVRLVNPSARRAL